MGVKLGLSTLTEEHKLRTCVNRTLRGASGPNRDEVTGWRKVRNGEHRNLYYKYIIKIIKPKRMRLA